MKKMKKVLALLLVVCMTFGMTFTASATESMSAEIEEDIVMNENVTTS